MISPIHVCVLAFGLTVFIDTQPPRFTNCPLVKTVYADENKTSAASVYIDSPDGTADFLA